MLNTTRLQIADALSTVAGITGHEYRPTVLGTGDAWPLLSAVEPAEGRDYITTWRVLVVLPPDERAAADALTDLLPPIFDVLRPLAFVDVAEAVTIQTSAGDLPGIQLTMRSD